MQSCYFIQHCELYDKMHGHYFQTVLKVLAEINLRCQEFIYTRNKL